MRAGSAVMGKSSALGVSQPRKCLGSRKVTMWIRHRFLAQSDQKFDRAEFHLVPVAI